MGIFKKGDVIVCERRVFLLVLGENDGGYYGYHLTRDECEGLGGFMWTEKVHTVWEAGDEWAQPAGVVDRYYHLHQLK